MKCPAKCRRLDGAKSSIIREHLGYGFAGAKAKWKRITIGPVSQPAARYPFKTRSADSPAGFCESPRAYLAAAAVNRAV